MSTLQLRLAVLCLLAAAPNLRAQQLPTPPADAPAATPPPETYFVEARSTGTRKDSQPPRYVRALDKVDWLRGENFQYIDFGLDYRARAEIRDDDLRRPVDGLDTPLLQRWRGYFGIHDWVDPFRFYVEYEDASRNNSNFPTDNRDVNRQEIIQAVAELHFEDAFDLARPLRLQAGRMAFEYVDRRLLARNEWRNTTNNFQGFRAILGEQRSDWQLDLLALKPVNRLVDEPDVAVHNQWFYGAIGDWRRWSSVATIQPYYLLLKQQAEGSAPEREIHTAGVRAYGALGKTGLDWDGQYIAQFGEDGPRDHDAQAATAELGYTCDHDWKPRLAGFFGYASGNKDPNDASNERFDRLFGFARPWSSDDYIQFENVIAPKTRVEFTPHPDVRVDVGWSWCWLASDTDKWGVANLRDPSGQSGSYMGDEFDARVRFKLGSHTDVAIGYAHFWPGEFTRNVGRDDSLIAHLPTVEALLEPLTAALANDLRLVEIARLREAAEADNRALLTRLQRDDISESVVGESTGLRLVMERVEQVARTDAPVLILGETGSGKEVVARAIHARSRRVDGPFLRVNCGAIPPELVDSELFGHERGSFTGAINTRRGWFERADGGTLFLDALGELPAAAQVRLLRVLQDGTFERVGGQRALHVDVRIVAATHRDMQTLVGDGRFRQDLWYRINVFPFHLPPLRERLEDIGPLAAHFAARAGRRLFGVEIAPSERDLALLRAYPWPGNVRELASVIERAAILGDGRSLALAPALGGDVARQVPVANAPTTASTVPPALPVAAEELGTLERAMVQAIEDALQRTRGRIEGEHGAARLLGINPHTLRSRMRKLGIEWSRFRAPL